MPKLDYLEQFGSQSTVRAYKGALKDFFRILYGSSEPVEELAEKYFSERRNHEEDIQSFMVWLKGRPPKTVSLKLAAVRIFLMENGVELPQRYWRRLRGRIRGRRAITLDKIPSPAELRKILLHVPIHGKALFLVLASSGLRIGEALKLKLNDLELAPDPARINVRGEYTKSGNSRAAFISREAREAVQEWLNVRDRYLEAAAAKSHLYQKDLADPRISVRSCHVLLDLAQGPLQGPPRRP